MKKVIEKVDKMFRIKTFIFFFCENDILMNIQSCNSFRQIKYQAKRVNFTEFFRLHITVIYSLAHFLTKIS